MTDHTTTPAGPVRVLLDAIEAARQSGALTNDQARAASVALTLDGDEALLAARLMSGGADPASLEYLAHGVIDYRVMQAHRQGPGIYKAVDADRDRWLTLAGLSADESKSSTLRQRVIKFAEGLRVLTDHGMGATVLRKTLAMDALAEITALPYVEVEVGSRRLPVYVSDRGFASAYWADRPCAAVFAEEGEGSYLAVGCQSYQTLAALGLSVDKQLGPQFGLIFDPAVVGAVRASLVDAGVLS